MRTSRAAAVAAVGLPPLLLAGIGLTHPARLDGTSAAYWRDLHIGLLPLFPLLGLGPWLVTRRVQSGSARVVALLAYVYAAAYTALDVLAGIGAGALQAAGRGEGTSTLFAWGNTLAEYGVWSYLAASVLAAVAAVRRSGRAAAPGALLALVGAWYFLGNHIYWPRGVLAMLALAGGWTAVMLTVTAGRRGRPSRAIGAASR